MASLSFPESKVKNPTHGTILVDRKWIEGFHKEVEYKIEYQHSIRAVSILLETEGSKKKAPNKESKFLKRTDPDDTESEQVTVSLDTKELFWSNHLRAKALTSGIQNYVPKVLYLLRPETAYNACLHFLAKELGGAATYSDQRQFLFNNSGINTCLQEFWKKVQEIYWSGAMSPGLKQNEKTELLCALLECFCHSMPDSSTGTANWLPVPHLTLEKLTQLGVHFPALERTVDRLTDTSMEILQADMMRPNLPGIPSAFTAYIQCDTCGTTFNTQEDMESHMSTADCLKTVTCNGCGITFVTSKDYKIHRMTFCKQSSLSGGKCPVCNTAGPRCICQQHWARTYGLISGLWENPSEETCWIIMDPKVTGTLHLGATILKEKLVTKDEQPVEKSPNPIMLKVTEWEKQTAMLPKQSDIYSKALLYDNRVLDLNDVLVAIEKDFSMEIGHVPNKVQLTTASPRSVKQDHSTARKKFKTYMRYVGFDPQTAVQEEIDELETMISDLKGKLDKPENAHDLTMILGMDIATLEAHITSLETWCKNAKIAQKRAKDNVKRLQGITTGIQNTNLGAEQTRQNLTETPRRSVFNEEGIKRRSSRSR